jgi:hypothetical protein
MRGEVRNTVNRQRRAGLSFGCRIKYDNGEQPDRFQNQMVLSANKWIK